MGRAGAGRAAYTSWNGCSSPNSFKCFFCFLDKFVKSCLLCLLLPMLTLRCTCACPASSAPVVGPERCRRPLQVRRGTTRVRPAPGGRHEGTKISFKLIRHNITNRAIKYRDDLCKATTNCTIWTIQCTPKTLTQLIETNLLTSYSFYSVTNY